MAQPTRRNSKAVTEFEGSRREVTGTQKPDAPLTEMQRLFVMHVVHDKMTQTAAARAAGFKGNPGTAGYDLMQNPKVQRAIAEERKEYEVASGVTKKKVIDGFLEAIDMGRMKGDPLAMIAGWREVGKMCGFFEPTKSKIEISVNGQVMVQRLNQMTDEELLAIAESDPSQILEGEYTAHGA